MADQAESLLFVVIADFNGYDQTRRCLEALNASQYRDFRVVVVDHGTTGETARGLRGEFPEVIRIPASPELWWTGATNRGIQHALREGAQAVMLLNNDCYVRPDTLGTLVRLWRQRPEAIIAPLQCDLESGKTLWANPRTLMALGFPTAGERRPPQGAAHSLEPFEVELICGGRGAVISATTLASNGLFDESRLPHYWADHDFYLRARKNGIRLYVTTQAVVDVDATRASAALDPGRLSPAQFVASLSDIRSHRNVKDVTELFRRHYPLKRLYMLGAALYTGRYVVMYVFRRIRVLLTSS